MMTTRSFSIVRMTVAGALIAFAPLASARTPGSVTVGQEARDTLKEMKGQAASAESDADQLEGFSRNNGIDSSGHIPSLTALKDDINAMGKEIAALEAERDSLEPWEQQAVDNVLPLLKDAAANTQGAIAYFNENKNHLWTPEYAEHTKKVKQDTAQIAGTLNRYLKYEKVRVEAEQLHTTIEGGAN